MEKGYLTKEKFRLYAQSPMAEDVTIGNIKLQLNKNRMINICQKRFMSLTKTL